VLRVVLESVTFPIDKSVPVVTCPDTPRPPVMTTDPEAVVVLAVPLVKEAIPEKVGAEVVAMTPEVRVMLVPAV